MSISLHISVFSDPVEDKVKYYILFFSLVLWFVLQDSYEFAGKKRGIDCTVFIYLKMFPKIHWISLEHPEKNRPNNFETMFQIPLKLTSL